MNIKYIILTFAVTILIAYILGLTILNTVNKGLSNVSINVPRQNITLKLKNKVLKEDFSSGATNVDNNNDSENDDSESESESEDEEEEKPVIKSQSTKLEDLKRQEKDDEVSKEKFGNMVVEPFTDDYITHAYVDAQNDKLIRDQKASTLFHLYQKKIDDKPKVCYMNHRHKSGDCTVGYMNHQDTHDMTDFEKQMYKANYPYNMTVQDYINWLWLYANDGYKKLESWGKEHVVNMRKLKKGDSINEVPNTKVNASKFFEHIYGDEVNLKKPIFNRDRSGITGFNCGDYTTNYYKVFG